MEIDLLFSDVFPLNLLPSEAQIPSYSRESSFEGVFETLDRCNNLLDY